MSQVIQQAIVIVHGDASREIRLRFNPTDAPLLGRIQHQPVDDTCFTRLRLSARELDDTARPTELKMHWNHFFIAVAGLVSYAI